MDCSAVRSCIWERVKVSMGGNGQDTLKKGGARAKGCHVHVEQEPGV